MAASEQSRFFGEEKISKILLRLAPPVMLAQLIQALYNIVDSLFVGRYSESGLTALSIVYPAQLLMIALAVGTGVGINTVVAARLGVGRRERAAQFAGMAAPLEGILWLIFALVSFVGMPAYARMSTSSPQVIEEVVAYGRIVGVGSFGLFFESGWTKVLQAGGDMKTPMAAQILGALVNILLDPLLIFGLFGLPRMGISGAAVATVAGQVAAALAVMRGGLRKAPPTRLWLPLSAQIFRLGTPNILMQAAYTFYILGLNLILAGFSDQAVTALGLYYKWQSFFFIPLSAMQTCMVPVVSFNYAARRVHRCRRMLYTATFFGMALMAVGTLAFECLPGPMLRTFTSDETVIGIGQWAFRVIGPSFLPMSASLIFPVFFQAVGAPLRSSALTLTRTLVLFVPLGYLFSRLGLRAFWFTFPVTEILTASLGLAFYLRFLQHPYVKYAPLLDARRPVEALQPSHPGVILTIARQHGSSGKEIGRRVAARLGVPFYYKEMTALAAQESGLDREFVANLNRNAPKVLYDLYLSTRVVRMAMVAQHQIIQKIAQNGSCVIVGRAADHVLQGNPNLVRVFIQAPLEYRIRRAGEVYGDTREEALENIRRSDRARAAYYRHISGRKWGLPEDYDLVLDSSCGVEESARKILDYLQSRGLAPKELPGESGQPAPVKG